MKNKLFFILRKKRSVNGTILRIILCYFNCRQRGAFLECAVSDMRHAEGNLYSL